jgi:hypothetical protein
MNKQIKQLAFGLITIALMGLGITGCKKNEIVVPPQNAFFVTNPATGAYRITAAGQVFKIPVGLTSVSDKDRTISFTVTSPTGATLNNQYTLASNTVTIPAGKAVDSIEVRAAFAQYQAGRKDTLIFTLNTTDVSPNIRSSYRLAISGPCFEGDVNLVALRGAYRNTREDFGGAYGPYTTTITGSTQTSATTGTITVANIYDSGWNPITFTLNWTDPNNRTVTLAQQSGIGDAGTVNPTYAGQDISVRPFAGQVGTFSMCNQTITIRMQVGVTGLGWFGTLYTVNMAR